MYHLSMSLKLWWTLLVTINDLNLAEPSYHSLLLGDEPDPIHFTRGKAVGSRQGS